MNFARLARRLAALEIWFVALLVAGSMLSNRLLPVALGVALLFWAVRWAGSGRVSVRTPADWPVALLALLVPVTLWASALPDTTTPQVYRLLTGVALYYALANWGNSPRRLRQAVTSVALAGLFLALSAPVSVQWSIGKLPFIPSGLYDRFTLLVSDTIHPNVLAGSLVILLPPVLAGLLFDGRRMGWSWLILGGLAALAMLGVLVLTQSRGAWMGLGAVLVALPALRWRRGWLALPLALAAVAGGVYWLGLERALDILASSSTISGIDGRVEIWSRAVYMIQDFPFTGVGMGSYGDVADVLYPFFLAAPGSVPHAHNLFLQVAVDLGLPGLVAWLAVLFSGTLAAWQVYRAGRLSGRTLAAGLGAGLLCSQLALVVHGVTDAVTWGMVRPAPLVWALWGLAVAGWNVYCLPQVVTGVANARCAARPAAVPAQPVL